MSGSSIADRLGAFLPLSVAERESLHAMGDREKALRRNAVLVRENDRSTDLFVLKRGTMMSYVILDDGSRQILRFLFPGDMIAVSTLAYGRSTETVVALNDALVCALDRREIARIIVEHPRLGGAILALDQMERVALTDRLAALGRTSARGRVAAVLLEIRGHARRLDPACDDTFLLGLTQEEIGDATGLTAVHVNRMMRQLEEEGLIARSGGRITMRDERALRQAANYVDRYSGVDLGWLPASR